MGNLKYTILYNGKTMTIREYSMMTGVPPETLRQRARDNRPIVQPNDREKYSGNLEAMRRLWRKGYPNGYTREEIGELYSHFAGQEDELTMLMDFTGLGRRAAEELLEELKYKRRMPA